jgi:hypothetical protein
VVGHDPAEHGVAEELEPLVRPVPRILRAPRTVGQGLAQERRIPEPVAEALAEGLQFGIGRQDYFTLV